jgi:HEAT repeat protein
LPSKRYLDGMTAPQLSVRSAKARALAHELSRRERRPIHAIVEDALVDYARRYPTESAAAFLRRMRALGDTGDCADLDAAIEEHRTPHLGIDL